ncbi:hypothetical protein E4U53_004861 [Claviceps sorghi]|nr:hypothetical protein E4U53_004861 [Claviceps sorghi]
MAFTASLPLASGPDPDPGPGPGPGGLLDCWTAGLQQMSTPFLQSMLNILLKDWRRGSNRICSTGVMSWL